MRTIRRLSISFLLLFLLPAMAAALWWHLEDRPASWRNADWSASGLLPPASADQQPQIHVLAARTGGMKGALSVHSWIVIKRPGATEYERFDKVGWGNPVRRNAYPADGNWYSNRPWLVHSIAGEDAARLIPQIDAAIASYPFNGFGDYRAWPGPNSNTFIAHILAQVPAIGVKLPANAVGRDYGSGLFDFHFAPAPPALSAGIAGVVGFSFDARSGAEMQLGGLVAGVNWREPGIILPGSGLISFTGLR